MAPPKITYSYFGITARGELSRLLFAYGGVAFEDHRVSDFDTRKASLPLGQLPVLEVDGKVFCQSGAIQRYAAKLSGLIPEDPIEALRVDSVSETLTELHTSYLAIRYFEPDAATQATKFKTFGDEAVPKYFGMLEGMLRDQQHQGKFFGGDKVSFADVQLFNVVHNALNVSLPEVSLTTYPKLLAIVAAIESSPRIAAYLAH